MHRYLSLLVWAGVCCPGSTTATPLGHPQHCHRDALAVVPRWWVLPGEGCFALDFGDAAPCLGEVFPGLSRGVDVVKVYFPSWLLD